MAGDVSYIARFEMGNDVGCGWLVEYGGVVMMRNGRFYSVHLCRCFGETASICRGSHCDQERFVSVRWCILRSEFFQFFFELLGGHVGLVYMRSLPDPIRCKAPRFLRPFYGRQQHAAVRGLPRMKSPTRLVAFDFRDADEQICRAS